MPSAWPGRCAGRCRPLLAAAAGALAILGPTYAWLGKPAFQALFARRDKTTQDSFYRFADLTNWKYLIVLSALLSIGMAVLLLWRMPAGDRLRPAVRPALGLSVAWLLVWPYTLPWYDAMIICVLVLFPASRLDWLILARLGAATIANMPGDPSGVPGRALRDFDVFLVHGLAPAVLLAVTVGVVVLAEPVRGRGSRGPARRARPVSRPTRPRRRTPARSHRTARPRSGGRTRRDRGS